MHIWESTLAYRRYLWSLGFGLAEAMDTAQRGMGLDWPTSLALIQHTLDAAKEFPNALVASGCGTDHLDPDQVKSLDDVIHAYEYQMEAIEALGESSSSWQAAHWSKLRRAQMIMKKFMHASFRKPSSPSSCTGWAICLTRH